MAFITPAEAEEYAKLVDADPRGPRFTERQAQAIIELQLQRLTGMEQQKILDELADIQKQIAEYMDILGSEKVLRGVVVKELKEVQKDFGDERRTADRRGHRRDHARRSGPGGGRRGHRYARRIPEAHGRRYLPPPDARRQGPHRHGRRAPRTWWST